MKRILLALVFLVASLFAQVNINSASAKELSGLKGIGMKKAEAIIQYRKNNGDFKNVEDLAKVKGIGPKVLEKIKAEIVVK